jgi:pimeloyl-ACP methyl ester carboxylesterase
MKRRWGEREITYDDVGAGPALVLLHPFPFDRRYWTTTVPALADGWRVITVDARGFGESDATGPFTIADLGDDLAALLDGLGLASAAVVGLSMGGYTALAFAHRHPTRLTSLVLADTRAAADTPEVRRAREDSIALIASAGVDTYLERSLPRLLAPDAPPDLLARVRALAETRADRLVAGIAALRDRPDRQANLRGIRCPTLVLAGARDQVIPPDEMRAMSEATLTRRFKLLEGAGHLASLEAAPAFEAAVKSFLNEAHLR